MSNNTEKPSLWCCDGCNRTLLHGEFRNNCTICDDFDYCEQCFLTVSPPHSHPMVRELAYGKPERIKYSIRDITTCIHTAMAKYCDRHCMGERDVDPNHPGQYADSYSWLTFKTVGDRSKNFGHGLRRLIETRDYLAICAANRPEWTMTDFACMFHSIISVPIYCLSTDRDITFILNQTKISVVVCDKKMLATFIRICTECPSLRHIVSMDPITDIVATENGIPIHYMRDVEEYGASQEQEYPVLNPDDCFTIIYSSGSTGFPKGAIVSEKAFRAGFPRYCSPFVSEAITFSYEPLAWAGGRDEVVGTFLGGGRTAFSTGDVSHLMEELALVRPTHFSGPPTIYNKIYSEFKAALSLTTVHHSPEAFQEEKEGILKQFAKLIPKRCRLIGVGGAMVSPVVLNFLRECFSHCTIYESYGITECGGVAMDNGLDDTLDYRLESVPEMGYTIDDKPFARGELLTKTLQMFSGYINNPEETQAAMTDDGYFRTGDIVEVRTPRLYVIDRKKNFFKLAQGQFVSPEYLEGIYIESPFVAQIYIHGDLLASNVSAVIVPNREYAQTFAMKNNSDQKISDAVMQDLRSIASRESLRKHEIPSALLIDFEPFTAENGLLTSTMKPCRPKLAAYYSERLKAANSIEQRLKSLIENATGRSLPSDDNESFIHVGNDSLTAVRLSRMIQNDLGVPVPVNVLFQSDMSLKRLVTLVQDPSQISLPTKSIVPKLLQDSSVELNITIGKCRTTDASLSTVFITGTTGYVGAFLLAELMSVYPADCKFFCLSRCQPLEDPINRIRDNLRFLHLWKDEFRERIIALRGDLAQDRFGLDSTTYELLATQTDIIFHCGAVVNFMLPYDKLYGPNVCGTREIIRLAAHGPTCIPVQHISTLSVLSPDVINEISIDETSPNRLTTGYDQSKWVAEKLMTKASRSGLPVVIYRLGSICGDTNTGACNRNDLYTLLTAAMMKIRCYPKVAINSTFDGLPVDFTAKSIVYLSQKQPTVYGSVYHVTNAHNGVRFTDIVDGMKRCGVDVESVSFTEWQTRMSAEVMQNGPFESLSEFLSVSLFIETCVVSSEQFYRAVSQIHLPSLDETYVFKWLSFILRNIVN